MMIFVGFFSVNSKFFKIFIAEDNFEIFLSYLR